MSFDAMDKSSDGVPLGAVVKPGNRKPLPLQGSMLSLTDSNINVLTGVVASDAIQEAVLYGRAFSATTGLVNNAGNSAIAGFSVFNASGSGVSAIIYELHYCDNQGGNTDNLLLAVTSNPSLATTITPVNRKLGSAASALSCTFLNTGFSRSGTTLDNYGMTDYNVQRFVERDTAVVLPAGSNHGVVFSPSMFSNATHYFTITAWWIEF